MSGHRPFTDLTNDWDTERLARSEARKAVLKAETVSLEQLREGLGLSQEELANVMEVQQPAISKLVRRPDMNVSTLRDDQVVEDRRTSGLINGIRNGGLTAPPGAGVRMTLREFLTEPYFEGLARLQEIGADPIVFGFGS